MSLNSVECAFWSKRIKDAAWTFRFECTAPKKKRTSVSLTCVGTLYKCKWAPAVSSGTLPSVRQGEQHCVQSSVTHSNCCKSMLSGCYGLPPPCTSLLRKPIGFTPYQSVRSCEPGITSIGVFSLYGHMDELTHGCPFAPPPMHKFNPILPLPSCIHDTWQCKSGQNSSDCAHTPCLPMH